MQIDWRQALSRGWREWVRPLAMVLIVCCSFRSAVADWNDVPTGSMKPTIVEGDRIFVNKLAYGLRVPFTSWRIVQWEGPQRGDIVVFIEPKADVRMVKRVVGLPGDEIVLRRNRLFINGKPVDYEALPADIIEVIPEPERSRHKFAREHLDDTVHPVMVTPLAHSRSSFGPIVVPEGSYFVMGDNRDNSRDSRWFGCISRDCVVGRATSVLLSVDIKNYYLPRLERFFHALR